MDSERLYELMLLDGIVLQHALPEARVTVDQLNDRVDNLHINSCFAITPVTSQMWRAFTCRESMGEFCIFPQQEDPEVTKYYHSDSVLDAMDSFVQASAQLIPRKNAYSVVVRDFNNEEAGIRFVLPQKPHELVAPVEVNATTLTGLRVRIEVAPVVRQMSCGSVVMRQRVAHYMRPGVLALNQVEGIHIDPAPTGLAGAVFAGYEVPAEILAADGAVEEDPDDQAAPLQEGAQMAYNISDVTADPRGPDEPPRRRRRADGDDEEELAYGGAAGPVRVRRS
jgi:hypothetical protein